MATTEGGPGKCPFAHLLDPHSKDHDDTRAAEPANGACPVKRDPNGPGTSSQSTAITRGCPLGFTSNADANRLSSLHCAICKSIFFLPCTTPCGHTFCQHCCARSRFCVVCGGTVPPGSAMANTRLQDTIDQFLNAHAGVVGFYDLYDPDELVAALKKQLEPPDGSHVHDMEYVERASARATFFMMAGTVSAMGGNEMAAWHWYWLARAVYLESLRNEAVPLEQREGLRKRLGILYGVMGDLNKGIGYDTNAVLTCYERAIEYLGDGASTDPTTHEEYQRARSALFNKAGEVYHSVGDVSKALTYYARALDVRRARDERLTGAQPATPMEIKVSSRLDLITSYAKVADAQHVLGMQTQSNETWQLGKTLLDDTRPLMDQVRLADAHATFNALTSHFDARERA